MILEPSTDNRLARSLGNLEHDGPAWSRLTAPQSKSQRNAGADLAPLSPEQLERQERRLQAEATARLAREAALEAKREERLRIRAEEKRERAELSARRKAERDQAAAAEREARRASSEPRRTQPRQRAPSRRQAESRVAPPGMVLAAAAARELEYFAGGIAKGCREGLIRHERKGPYLYVVLSDCRDYRIVTHQRRARASAANCQRARETMRRRRSAAWAIDPDRPRLIKQTVN